MYLRILYVSLKPSFYQYIHDVKFRCANRKIKARIRDEHRKCDTSATSVKHRHSSDLCPLHWHGFGWYRAESDRFCHLSAQFWAFQIHMFRCSPGNAGFHLWFCADLVRIIQNQFASKGAGKCDGFGLVLFVKASVWFVITVVLELFKFLVQIYNDNPAYSSLPSPHLDGLFYRAFNRRCMAHVLL